MVARLADGSLGVGTGTTSAPPTTLASYVAAREGQEIDRGYRVAIGRDGRLLVAWSQTGESGSALVAARQAPGAPSPQLSVLDSYTATTGGYPASFSVTGAILDNSGRSLVALEQSSPTGPYAYIRRSVGPDGAFDRARQILSSGRYTFATRSFLEGTGAVTSFAFAVDTTGQGPGGIFSRRLTAAGRTTRDVGLGPVARHFAWGADVGPNGSTAIALSNRGTLRVRTRSEQGVWDRQAQKLVTSLHTKSGRPAVSVSATGRKIVAYPVGGRVLYALGKTGAPFGRMQVLRGSDGCRKVRLEASGSGRTVAVLECGDATLLSTLDAG